MSTKKELEEANLKFITENKRLKKELSNRPVTHAELEKLVVEIMTTCLDLRESQGMYGAPNTLILSVKDNDISWV